MDDSHTFATTPGSSLDDDRVANPSGDANDCVGIVRQRSIRAGDTGYPGLAHHFDRRYFIPHQADSFGCRPDENKAALFYVLCKISIFSQKTITRMDSTGIGHFSRCDHGRDVEVASRGRGRPDTNRLLGKTDILGIGVGFRMQRHGLDAEFSAGPQNPQCDLAAVRDHQFVNHGRLLRRCLRQ